MKPEIKDRVEKIRKGEVPEGYKDTKVGIIPDDWDNKNLIQIADYVDYRGKTPQKTNNGVFLVTAKNIKKGFIDYKTSKEFVSVNEYMDIMSRGLPKLGDVLITTEAPVGNVAQIDKENIALAQRVIKYRGKENEIDNTYMKFYFLGFKFQKEILIESTGGTVQGIKGSRLHKLKVSFPKIKEQKKISEILSTWNKAIELEEKLIEEKNEFKRGFMQKLLTGETRFPKFIDDWKEVKISKLLEESCELSKEPNLKRQISVKLHLNGVFSRKLKGNEVDGATALYVRKAGQFIYGKQNFYNGAFGIIPKELDNYQTSSDIPTFDFKDEINPMYFFYYWSQKNKYLRLEAFTTGTGSKRLNPKEFLKQHIIIPDIAEQSKIVESIKSVDNNIDLLNKELNQLKEQKKGLMQLLLTGIVRVEVD